MGHGLALPLGRNVRFWKELAAPTCSDSPAAAVGRGLAQSLGRNVRFWKVMLCVQQHHVRSIPSHLPVQCWARENFWGEEQEVLDSKLCWPRALLLLLAGVDLILSGLKGQRVECRWQHL